MALIKQTPNASAPAIPSTVSSPITSDAEREQAQMLQQVVTAYEAENPAETQQALAVSSPNPNAVAVITQFASSSVAAALQEQGFEGVEFDFTSYPTLKLQEGQFMDMEENSYGSEFQCRLHSMKVQWLYRALTKGQVVNNKTDLLYSQDQITATNGSNVENWVREQEASGKEVEIKQYRMVLAEFYAPGEDHDGEFVMLQVAPTSKGRISAAISTAMIVGQGQVRNAVVTVKVGKKVTSVQNPFYPWDFSVQRAA